MERAEEVSARSERGSRVEVFMLKVNIGIVYRELRGIKDRGSTVCRENKLETNGAACQQTE